MDISNVMNSSSSVDSFAQGKLRELREMSQRAQKNETAEAGKAVESLFASMLVKELQRGLDTGFFVGPGSQVFSSWLDEHLGKTLADRDALGLAGMVKEFAIRKEEAAELEMTP